MSEPWDTAEQRAWDCASEMLNKLSRELKAGRLVEQGM